MQQTRPAVSLALLLADYFGGINVEVKELVPRWVKVPDTQRNSLGAANSSLGTDLTIGARVLDRAGKIRIAIGPVTYAEYESFLPGTSRFHDLNALVRLWLADRLDFDIELRLHRHEVPALQMSSQTPPRMAWTTWALSGDGGVEEDPRIVFGRLRFEECSKYGWREA